jgi:WD40 repeat protein
MGSEMKSLAVEANVVRSAPKRRPRLAVLSWFLLAVTLAALTGLWWSLPPTPRLIIEVDATSYLMGFSPDGTLLVTQGVSPGRLSWAGPIRLWSVATGREMGCFFQDGPSPAPARWSAEGGRILIPETDSEWRRKVLDVATDQDAMDVGKSPWITPDGTTLALCVLGDAKNFGEPKECIWPVPADEVWDRFPEVGAGPVRVGNVASMPPDHNLLVAERTRGPGWTAPDGELMLWDVRQGRERAHLGRVSSSSSQACFSSDAESLAVDSQDYNASRPGIRSVRLIDVATGQERATFVGARCPLFIQGGRALAAFYPDPTEQWCVKFWDSAKGKEVGHAKINSAQLDCDVGSLQTSPDGKTLAVSASYKSKPNSISVWTARWSLLQRAVDLCLHRISNGPALKIFDAVTGQELAALPPARCHWFSPDGKLFATKRTDESKIRVWDVPPRKPWGSFALLCASLVMATATVAEWIEVGLANARVK